MHSFISRYKTLMKDGHLNFKDELLGLQVLGGTAVREELALG